jgi:hypothetical protein
MLTASEKEPRRENTCSILQDPGRDPPARHFPVCVSRNLIMPEKSAPPSPASTIAL